MQRDWRFGAITRIGFRPVVLGAVGRLTFGLASAEEKTHAPSPVFAQYRLADYIHLYPASLMVLHRANELVENHPLDFTWTQMRGWPNPRPP